MCICEQKLKIEFPKTYFGDLTLYSPKWSHLYYLLFNIITNVVRSLNQQTPRIPQLKYFYQNINWILNYIT